MFMIPAVLPSWVSAAYITKTISSTTDLVNIFKTAEANPDNFYGVTLKAGTYKLPSTLKLTVGSVRLMGNNNNPASVTLDGQGQRCIVQVWGIPGGTYRPYLELNGVRLQNGYAVDQTGLVGGGAVRVVYGIAHLSYSIVRNNQTNLYGAGLFAQESYMNLWHVWVDNNANTQFSRCGGGLTSNGGGIGFVNSTVGIYHSTISNNKACRGGGIAVTGTGEFTMENSTVSGNDANRRGGGIFLGGGSSPISMRFNTITNNKAGTSNQIISQEKHYGGGLAMASFNGTMVFEGNILAKNSVTYSQKNNGLYYDGHDCYWDGGTFGLEDATVHDNVIGILDNCSHFGSSYWWGIGWSGAPIDPQLQSLASNGAVGAFQMPTHMPASGSMVINNFWGTSNSNCAYEDQRHYKRPNAGTTNKCDVGSVEYGGTK